MHACSLHFSPFSSSEKSENLICLICNFVARALNGIPQITYTRSAYLARINPLAPRFKLEARTKRRMSGDGEEVDTSANPRGNV